MIGASIAHRVSPVVTSFRPIAAAMSPARTSLISSRLLACIWTIRPKRSFLDLTGFSTVSPELTTPEYTRKNVRLPTNGSVAILNARDANGSSSEEWRSAGVSLPSSRIPLIAGTSVGDGRYSTTASSIAWTPLFLNAEPQVTRIISFASTRWRNADLISASVSSSPPRYFSISSSEASAAASTRFWCHSAANSCMFAGISS